MKHQDLRSTDDKICDMLADEHDFEAIGRRLQMTEHHVEARFRSICHKLGKQAK